MVFISDCQKTILGNDFKIIYYTLKIRNARKNENTSFSVNRIKIWKDEINLMLGELLKNFQNFRDLVHGIQSNDCLMSAEKVCNYCSPRNWKGRKTTKKLIIWVGVERFELSTSWSRTKRANRAALHPENNILDQK